MFQKITPILWGNDFQFDLRFFLQMGSPKVMCHEDPKILDLPQEPKGTAIRKKVFLNDAVLSGRSV